MFLGVNVPGNLSAQTCHGTQGVLWLGHGPCPWFQLWSYATLQDVQTCQSVTTQENPEAMKHRQAIRILALMSLAFLLAVLSIELPYHTCCTGSESCSHSDPWNLQSQQSNLENLTARLLSSSHPPTNGITSLQGITRKWLLLPIFTGDCFPSQPWTMPFNTWQVSLVSFLVCPWTSHGLHKELKVSRVDCVDTVDHNGSHISNVSGSFQGHQSADSPDQTGPRIVVPSCCCQLLHPRSIRNIMEYSYVVVASCGWFWLFAASWTDDLRRICRWYSWYGWYVRVVNGTKNWLVNWWYPSRLIHASPQQTVELCLPESGRIHGSTASGSFSQ